MNIEPSIGQDIDCQFTDNKGFVKWFKLRFPVSRYGEPEVYRTWHIPIIPKLTAYPLLSSTEVGDIPVGHISFRPRFTHRATNGQITYIEYEEI